MAFPSRTLRAVCEISSGTLQISQRPPAYTHEAGALSVVVDLKNDGAAYVPDASIVAGMYLFWPDTQYMSELVEMDIVGCTLSGTFGDALTAMPGCPLLVVQLQDTDTNDVIVAAAAPIQITKVEGSLIVTTRPPSPSEIIYVGRSPYINLDNYHWMQWDNSLRAYVDTGVVAKGPQGDPGPVATVCGVSPDAQGNVPLKGSDIPLQTMSLQTVAQAINDLGAVFTGATSQSAGVKGLVPAPAQGATGKILLSDGTWADPPTGSAIPTSSSDNTPIATSLSNLNDQIGNLTDIETLYNANGIVLARIGHLYVATFSGATMSNIKTVLNNYLPSVAYRSLVYDVTTHLLKIISLANSTGAVFITVNPWGADPSENDLIHGEILYTR